MCVLLSISCITDLNSSESQSSLNILSHSEWNSLRNTQTLSFLKANIIINMNNLKKKKKQTCTACEPK